MPNPLSAISMLALFASALPGFAQTPERFDLGGHEVLLEPTEDFTWALRIDGQVVLEDAQVLLDPVLDVAGQPVLAGVSGAGGNICNAAPFVITLENGAPSLAGPIETCEYLERSVEADALVYANTARPGMDSEVWRWRAATGWETLPGQSFSPIAGQDWSSFAGLKAQHPIDALGFAPVYAQIKDGLSAADFSAYALILAELGSGDLTPQGYAGSACTKQICDSEWAYLWIDPQSKQAVALWKSDADEEPHSYPSAPESWPEWIRLDAAAQLQGAG